jgi:hypothetical protein
MRSADVVRFVAETIRFDDYDTATSSYCEVQKVKNRSLIVRTDGPYRGDGEDGDYRWFRIYVREIDEPEVRETGDLEDSCRS